MCERFTVEIGQREPANLIMLIRVAVCGFPRPAMDEVQAECEACDTNCLPALHIIYGAVDAELFAQFADRCLPWELTGFNVAAWQVPNTGIAGAMLRAPTQQHAVISEEDDCGGLNWWELRTGHIVQVW